MKMKAMGTGDKTVLYSVVFTQGLKIDDLKRSQPDLSQEISPDEIWNVILDEKNSPLKYIEVSQ